MTTTPDSLSTTPDSLSTHPTAAADVNIDAATLRQLLREDPAVRVLDVRTGGEFESRHIPGAYNVPLDTLSEHAGEFADLERPIVLVCRSGARATKAHVSLNGAGLPRLYVLDGGLDAWESAGGDVVVGDQTRWAMDRQVRFAAGSIALAGILASVVVPKAKWLAGGVAAGLVFSAVTNTCAMGTALSKLPYNRSDDCDIDGVLADLRRAA